MIYNSLRKFEGLHEIYEVAKNYVESNDLVGIVSFYLEDELLDMLINNLENKFNYFYKKYKNDRDLFLKEISKHYNYNMNKNNFIFIYNAIPIGERVEVGFISNNWLPVACEIISGKVRLTFSSYRSFAELEESIKTKNEDDIVLEFKDGVLYSYEIKRNIFMDYRVVKNFIASKSNMVLLTPTRSSFLIPSIISINVELGSNRVVIKRNNELLTYEIVEGKAKKDDVIAGNTLSLISKAELYYDVKSKKVSKKSILDSFITKIP